MNPTTETIEIPVASIVFREDLYPRLKGDPATVQKYAETIDVMPPIEVNQRYELIDGWHRWTAHRKLELVTAKVVVTETKSDAHLLELAIERNAAFGLQLSQEDKQGMARRLYSVTPESERDAKKTQLARILSVSERTVRGWLSRIDKDSKDARNKRIFASWLACYTQDEIAKTENLERATVDHVLRETAELPESAKPAAAHLVDFDVPIFNVWKQQTKTDGVGHFGNSETRWVDNLLYLYTKPFDIVVDPFAGSGSTIDVCKKRFRRYWVADRKPIVEREKEIRTHDITTGAPDLKGRWGDVKLVYLDPPYWKQAFEKYSKDGEDLANMSLADFTRSLAGVISAFAAKLKAGSFVALILQPTQWSAPERAYTDHVADMIRAVKLPIDLRIQAPYESQQATAQMVEWAKENRKVLVLSREIVVWRVD